MKYIDPDGREYSIVGSKEFVKRVETDIKKIESGKNGGAAIKEMRASEKMTTIVQSTDGKNQTTPGSYVKVNLGLKTDSIIAYNPDKTSGPVDAKGGTERPAFVGLGHEIGHSNALASGTQSLDRGEKKNGTTPPAEQPALKTENGIREDHGLPLRPAYYDRNNSEK